jgi:hypothetical protein
MASSPDGQAVRLTLSLRTAYGLAGKEQILLKVWQKFAVSSAEEHLVILILVARWLG